MTSGGAERTPFLSGGPVKVVEEGKVESDVRSVERWTLET